MKLHICLLITALLLTACGRKGALMPPEALVPAAVTDLTVLKSGDDFRITWSAPAKERGGRPLRDLSGFRLFKRVVLGDGTDCSSCAESWRLLAEIDANNPGTGRKSGAAYIYHDKPSTTGKGDQYRIFALSSSGGFSPSAESAIKKNLQPVQPPDLSAVIVPGAIMIRFISPLAADPRFAGYNLYKRTPGDSNALLPLHQVPLKQDRWEDQQLKYGTTYCYSATVLTEIDGELVESARSVETEIAFTLQELH